MKKIFKSWLIYIIVLGSLGIALSIATIIMYCLGI
jgi:hypothetical protein